LPRRLALVAVLAAVLALPAAAGAAVNGKFFEGTPIDGPSADIRSLGDLDVARDGTGALAYVKRVGGVDHVFVSRLVNGVFGPGEQVDAGLGGAGADPTVAVSDGGRLVVGFVNGSSVYSVVRPAGAGYAPVQQVAAVGVNPDVEMSINGVAYLTWSSGGNVFAGRLERNGVAFNAIPGALNIDPTVNAGTGTGRPRVAVAADGVATVVWGEGGHVYARRIFELRLSTSPQDLGADSDLPEIGTEDDSSFAWVAFRQNGTAVARRLLGSQFDPPVTIEGGEMPDSVHVAVSGRGIGYAGIGGQATDGAYGAVLKDDIFNPGAIIGGGFGVPSFAVPAVAETGWGMVAYQQGDASGGRSVHARPYDYVPASRAVTPPGPDVLLSNPALGATDASRGMLAGADRAGDLVLAFVQGTDANSQIVGAAFDRAPGTFRGSTSTKFRRFAHPRLKWSAAFELWGPLTYTVLIDNNPAGQTTSTGITVPVKIADGLHRWRVVATDRRGQTSATPTRNMRVDATPPKVTFRVSGARKRGAFVKVGASVTDASGTTAKASGLKNVRISFGDGSAAIPGRHAAHRYSHSGHFTVRVSAADNAGNVVTKRRRITIRK
jgi:hypothetical protein